MSLEHAILGFLNYHPFTGYDLKKTFDHSVRHFWPADQSQIYRTLARLAERGWAEVEPVTQEDAPTRKVYHITDAGQKELHQWMTTARSAAEVRSAELIQVFFAGQLDDQEILTLFKESAQQVREQLVYYCRSTRHDEEEGLAGCKDKVAPGRDEFFWWLTLENGVVSMRALLEWIESVIQRLENQDYTMRYGDQAQLDQSKETT